MEKQFQQDKAYDFILAGIIDETYTSGMPLREIKLAKECGVSPTSFRGALKRLKMEGWVDSKPYCGSFVKKFTNKEIYDIYLVREALESIAAREAAKNATSADLARMKTALEEAERYIDLISHRKTINKITQFKVFELQFHGALVEASHIGVIKEKLDILKLQIISIALFPEKEYDMVLENKRFFHKQHCMIYEAVKNGLPDSAEAIIREHLSSNSIKTLVPK